MNNSERYLYRGYGLVKFKSPQEALTPKTFGEFAYTNKYDGTWQYDGSADHGHSPRNAVLRHQLGQLGLSTSGISTTPHKNRAAIYSRGKNQLYKQGMILVIDRKMQNAFGIKEYVVSDTVTNPSVPEDDEVILARTSGGVLPIEIVVAYEPVFKVLHEEKG